MALPVSRSLTVFGEPVARGQARLPGPDHQGVDILVWSSDAAGHVYFFAAFGGSPATCSNAFSTQALARASSPVPSAFQISGSPV